MFSQQAPSSNLKLFGIFALVYALVALINFLVLGVEQLCPWRALCGFPCPGCGLTHAGLFLLFGNIRESLVWHPFLLPYIAVFSVLVFPGGNEFLKKNGLWVHLLNLACIAYFIYRLICFYPQDPCDGPMFYDPRNYIPVLSEYL